MDGQNVETTFGRILFNNILPPDYGFVNKMLRKKEVSEIIGQIIEKYGNEESSFYVDQMKKIGFFYATYSGITWAMSDLNPPKEKPALLAKAELDIASIRHQYEEGLLTDGERRARVLGVWEKTKEALAKLAPSPGIPVHLFHHRFRRPRFTQLIQMIGMKGLVANPKTKPSSCRSNPL